MASASATTAGPSEPSTAATTASAAERAAATATAAAESAGTGTDAAGDAGTVKRSDKRRRLERLHRREVAVVLVFGSAERGLVVARPG